MGFRFLLFLLLCVTSEGVVRGVLGAGGLACNWGTRSTHPLPPKIVVKLLKDNGFSKVKLFEADAGALQALGRSGIQVMVGIPNDLLAPLASSVTVAEKWVSQNVSSYISKNGVDIRYVAVGNEPFLTAYKDTFLQTTFPALQNIQAALIKAGLGRQVKVTIPINADVYQTDSGLPSGGDFRSDIRTLMMSIMKFLSDNNGVLTINIYPFLSLQADPDFPKEYAFFNNTAKPVVDGSISYTNVLDANFDTCIAALEKNGFSHYARRFNQGLVNRILAGQGTPKRSTAPEIYIFALIDEDAKSVLPGNFERHWGMFNYDGSIKYPLDIGSGKSLVPAKGVRYLARQWCVMSPDASTSDPNLAQSVNYACTYADCTSLGYGSSCGMLDAKSNASYAFNMYFQTMDQRKGACNFSGLSVTTNVDPTPTQNGQRSSCRFEIMIDLRKHEPARRSPALPAAGLREQSSYKVMMGLLVLVLVSTLIV
ncbi:glucan endo-1,3-beta-glucosidase 5-like [Pyrus ussuriensis x Pyrus communis]|uniref:glucan endo-1,3-beta-D-glucosidase n=1 Tax=Pyrus ussuriensis x Pyrus communis TaxID=2448454 RepID=A0A5N5GWH9_9ROSA|nr:glucan endo-1,3-beta-glucosidase 5-like [Pyrus ussuriensis x Pyrus communis]